MTDSDPARAWFAAWTSAMGPQAQAATPDDITRRLLALGQDYAGIARDSWKFFGGAPDAAAPATPAAMQAAFAESYRRLLIPAAPFDPAGAAAASGVAAALARCQRAWQGLAAHAAAIATEAARRLAAALADDDPAAAPVASLRELHDLWVECGEQAWSSAVQQESYAAAQAEWLAAVVDLIEEQRRAAAAVAQPRGPGP